MVQKAFIEKTIKALRKEAGPALKETTYSQLIPLKENPFQVLIGTVLSQRTRDENTAKASKQLFRKYSNPKQLAQAKTSEIEKLIKPAGFYKTKAKRIKQVSKEIIERFKGITPNNLGDLLSLPGVGRKTAGCVLVYGYNKAESIPVDTHVHRFSNRVGLAKTKTPEQTEQQLMKILPKKYWKEFNSLGVKFGQTKCKPIKPLCSECSLKKFCEYAKNNPS